MDLPTLIAFVSSTPLLSEAERAWWKAHLPTMMPEQCAQLEKILTQKIDLPFVGVITNFIRGLAGGKVA